MSLDKKIKDTFNPPPSLKGEDWLVPSDDLFDSIESAIYNEPREKRRGIWIWLLPLLFISGIAIYFMTLNTQSIARYSNNGTKEFQSTMNTFNDHGNEGNVVNHENLTLKENTTNDKISSSKIKSIIQNSSISSIELSTATSSGQSNKVLTFNNSENLMIRAITDNNKPSVIGYFSVIGSKIGMTEIATFSDKDRSTIDLAKLSGINNFIAHESTPLVSDISLVTIDVSKSGIPRWNLKLFTGMTNWNFDLNNNYLTALQPADFSFSNGVGYFVELGIEKRLSKRVSVGVSVLAERNTFDSGHNSVIDYNINNENSDNTNEFDLTMASPLGFLESNIVVARSVDANDHTDLIIDLENKHTVSNIDLGLYAQLDILQYRSFCIGGQIGGGLNHLSSITNSLDHFSTSESGFDSRSSEILKGQSDLNLLRPYFNFGVNLEYKWSHNISIGLNHQYRQDLNAIYNSGDFSTLVNRQLSGLYIKKTL